jgi:copper transport protein
MRAVIGMCVLLLALAAAHAPAWAHATLVEASPADGQVLPGAPRVAQLRFNEPVSLLVVQLIDGSGQAWSGLAVRASGERIEIELPPGLGRGSHVLSYRVVSADGHPVGGSLTFAIGQATGRPELVAQGDVWVSALLWLSRVIMYVGLFIGAGGAFFLAWLAPVVPRMAARITQAAIAAGLAAALLSIGYQGLDALAAPLRSYWTRTVWAAGFGTSFGATAVAAVCALVAASLALVGPAVARRVCAAAGLLGAGLALSLSGHASAAGPWWLTRPAVFVHAVCVAYWIGALAPLAALLGGANGEAAMIVRKWSAGAVLAVAALVITGAALALIQVPTWAGLVETAYGRILLAKLAMVAALLGLAAFNRFRLTPAVAANAGAERALRRSIATELVLAVIIFALVAFWRFTPPPRSIVAAAAVTSAHLHGERGMADVVLQPDRTGPVRATITIYGADGAPLTAKEVTLILSNRGAGIEPIARQAARNDDASWRADVVLPVAGRWQLRVDALITDFEKLMLETDVDIKP